MLMLWQDADTRVVQHVLHGKHNEFGVLVERYLPVAQAVARGNLINPADTEDVVQESFVAAFQKLDTLAKPQRFGPWLLTIVRNTARSWSRKQRRETSLDAAEGIEPIAVTPRVEKEEMRRILEQTLLGMDLEQREILMLHYYAGKSLRDIAELQGVSREAAAKRLQRARQALGDELLKVVPEECPSKETVKKRAKLITAVAVAAPIAWKATPAYAATAMMAASVVKWTLAASLVAGTVAATYVAAPKLFRNTPPAQAEVVSEPLNAGPAPAPVAETPAVEIPPTEEEPKSEVNPDNPVGTNTLSSVLVDLQDKPVPNAEVTIELITWGPTELPPAKTARWTGHSDAGGRFTFENLPNGPYSIIALGNGIGGANDALLQAKYGYKPRNIKMYPFMPSGGVLKDENGAPVEGAALYPARHVLFPEEEFDHWTVAGARAATDKEGKFRFKGLIPGGWILFVVAPNRPPMYTHPFEIPTDTGEIAYEVPGGLKGQVLDAGDGQSMPHVKLTAVQGDLQAISVSESGDQKFKRRVQYEAISDDNGAFSFDALFPGDYQILVDDSMLCLAAPKLTAKVQAGAATEGFAVRVSTGGQIAGRVLDKTTEQGIPRVKIATYGRDSDTSKQGTTNAAGEYRVTGLPPGQYDVRIDETPSGYLRPGYEERPIQVTLESPQEGVNFLLEPGLTVSGQVLDKEGQPVEGANLTAQTMNPDSRDFAESIADGSFSLSHLPQAKSVTVTAMKEDWKSQPLTAELNDGLSDVVLTLDFLAASTIEGVVLDSSGKPLMADVTGHCIADGEDDTNGFYERTEADGRFKAENVAAGRYSITASPRARNMVIYSGFVSPDGSEPIKPAETIVDVRDRENLKNIVVRFEGQNDQTLSGKVVSPDGKPMLYAAVTLVEMQKLATPQLGGAFSFDGLPNGSFTVCAASPGYSPVMAHNVAAGTKDLVLKLERTAKLRGRVVDGSNQSPIDVFEVTYKCVEPLPLDNMPGLSGQRVYKEAAGQFLLEGLPTLPLRVTVKAEGYSAWEQTLEPLKGGLENPLLVELSKGGIIEGFVHDAAGNPVGQAAISGKPSDMDMNGTTPITISASDGTFVLTDQKTDAEGQFVASKDGYVPTVFRVTPQSGGTTRADVLLDTGGTLRVHVTVNGQPADEFYASLEYDDPDKTFINRYDRASISNGEQVFSKAPAGEVRVNVLAKVNDAYLNGVERATIVSGQETTVEVNIDSGSCKLEGRLTINGIPTPSGLVTIENHQDKTVHASCVTNADGYYLFEEQPAGWYDLDFYFNNEDGSKTLHRRQTVALQEGRIEREDFNLEEGQSVQGRVQNPMPDCEKMYVVVYEGLFEPQLLPVLQAQNAIKPMGMSLVGGDGQFQIDHLSTGAYTVLLTCGGAIPEDGIKPGVNYQHVIVQEEGTAEVVF